MDEQVHAKTNKDVWRGPTRCPIAEDSTPNQPAGSSPPPALPLQIHAEFLDTSNYLRILLSLSLSLSPFLLPFSFFVFFFLIWCRFPARRPQLNGENIFYAGWLDQSWWPDGQYQYAKEKNGDRRGAREGDGEAERRERVKKAVMFLKIYSSIRLGTLFWRWIREDLWLELSEVTSEGEFGEMVLVHWFPRCSCYARYIFISLLLLLPLLPPLPLLPFFLSF